MSASAASEPASRALPAPARLVVVGVELPAPLLRAFVDWQARVEDLRRVQPTELRLWLLATVLPAPEAADALTLAARRLAVRTAPFSVAPGPIRAVPQGAGVRLEAAILDPDGALSALRQALAAALGDYGFEVPEAPPAVPLGRAPRAPEPLPPVETAGLSIPVRTLRWGAPGALATGVIDLTGAEARQAAEQDSRDRDHLEAELARRLARRPKPSAARSLLPRPARRLSAALDTDDEPASDDTNLGSDDDSDDTTQ